MYCSNDFLFVLFWERFTILCVIYLWNCIKRDMDEERYEVTGANSWKISFYLFCVFVMVYITATRCSFFWPISQGGGWKWGKCNALITTLFPFFLISVLGHSKHLLGVYILVPTPKASLVLRLFFFINTSNKILQTWTLENWLVYCQ